MALPLSDSSVYNAGTSQHTPSAVFTREIISRKPTKRERWDTGDGKRNVAIDPPTHATHTTPHHTHTHPSTYVYIPQNVSRV